MAEKLTAADKQALQDEFVRHIKQKIDTVAAQAAEVGPTLTAANRRVYEDSASKRIYELQDQVRHLQRQPLRPFVPQEAIADGALVKARFEPAGRPATEAWILIVPGIVQSQLAYKGNEIGVGGEGNFGYGGSLLGLRAGESRHVHGDGRSIPDCTIAVLEVL